MNKEIFKNHQFKKGFTLIELLIVIAIVGVLATLLMVNFVGVRQRARDAQRKSDLRQMQSALEIYRADNSSYPASGNGNGLFPTTCGNSFVDLNNSITYMQKVPCDPLNTSPNVYTYTPVGTAPYLKYQIVACLENVNDSQKDPVNNASCGSSNWSYTINNP